MGVQLSGTLHPTHIYKMTDCSEYDVQFATEKVKDHKFETTDAGAKSCAGKVEPADTTQYVWDYKNDENKDLGLEVGAVVHNREWSYGLIKYASLVQTAVSFKARCTFSFRDEGATRTLRIVDDTGYVHGELDINIHAGTPCVCAVPRKEKIAVKDKVIRCPQKLSNRKAGNCGEKPPTPSSSASIAEVNDGARVTVEKKYRADANRMMQAGVEAVRKQVASKYGVKK